MAPDRNGPLFPALPRVLAPLLLLVLTWSPVFGGPAAEWAAWYEQSLEWQACATPSAVPAGGLTIERHGANWILEKGEVRRLAPAPDGAVTGFVFHGRGRFSLPVPNPRERNFFAFRSGTVIDNPLEFTFTALTMRSAEDLGPLLPAELKSTKLEKNGALEASHRRWLRNTRRDVDARVAAGRLVPGDRYLIAEMEAEGFGPLTVEYEPFRPEQLRLERHREANDHPEVWISQPAPEAAGRTPLIDLAHAELRIDLQRHAGREAHDIAQGGSPLGSGYARKRQWPWTEFTAVISFTPQVDGLRALPLLLEPLAAVQAVRDGDGRAQPFLRDHLGRRAMSIHNTIHDDSLVVLLDEPLPAGREAMVEVDYRMRTSNQVLGRDWYPRPADRAVDRHTARLTAIHPKKIQIRATGRLEQEDRSAKPARTTWVCDTPLRSAGWSYGKGFKEVTVEREGLPPVCSFGTEDGITVGDTRRNVGRDLLDCLAFLEDYLGAEAPVEQLLATRVTGYTQPYEGFVNLSVFAYNRESAGLSKLLRGREASAQFWVNTIEWPGYRDQWLVEALTDLGALLTIENGEDRGYYGQLIKSINARMIESRKGTSRRAVTTLTLPEYDRVFSSVPGNGCFRDSEWLYLPSPQSKIRWQPHDLKNMGPIALGFRSSPAEVPYAHAVWNHQRGLLVLHMLRSMIDHNPATSDRDLFREILSGFYRAHAGGRASTADFIAMVEQVTGAEWGWFFDQWVFGRATPTLSWSWSAAPDSGTTGGYLLAVEVEKSDVPADFKVMIPVWVEFDGGRVSRTVLPLDRVRKRFEIPVPEKPAGLVFNPRHEVLAQILEKK